MKFLLNSSHSNPMASMVVGLLYVVSLVITTIPHQSLNWVRTTELSPTIKRRVAITWPVEIDLSIACENVNQFLTKTLPLWPQFGQLDALFC